METEYQALMQNGTWTLVDRPKDKNVITSKWVYQKKGERYKARLVARGCSQQWGINYTETYAPLTRLSSLRLLCAISAQKNLEMFHLDEEVLMEQPEGFNVDS